MAITDTKQAKDFTAGAPKITLEGDLRPNQMMAGSSRYQIILDELINEMEDALGRPITNDEYDQLGREAYEKLYESSISTELLLNLSICFSTHSSRLSPVRTT